MAKFTTRSGKPVVGMLGTVPSIDAPLLGSGMALGGRGKKKGKTRKEITQQGGARSKRLEDTYVFDVLEEHGFSPSYHANGGVTANVFIGNGRNGRPRYDRKYFGTNTTLGTLRDWLGY